MSTNTRTPTSVSVRARTLLLAMLLGVVGFAVQASPAVVPRQSLQPEAAQAYACADGPSFQGWITSSTSSHPVITRSTSGNVYGYISNVVDDWSCTAWYRYDGLVWARNADGSRGNFAWGNLIHSTSVSCNWVIGSTDYLKANGTNDCPDSDAEYAHQFFLGNTGTGSLLQAIYHQDVSPDEPGDFAFIHSDCEAYYGSAPTSWDANFNQTRTIARAPRSVTPSTSMAPTTNSRSWSTTLPQTGRPSPLPTGPPTPRPHRSRSAASRPPTTSPVSQTCASLTTARPGLRGSRTRPRKRAGT